MPTLQADRHPPAVDLSMIRLAEREDEDDLMAMCHQLYSENALRSSAGPIPMSEAKVRAQLHRAIMPQRNAPDLPAWIGIIGEPGRLEGSVYLAAETPWYSDHVVLAELWNYVLPEFRNSDNARRLIGFAKAFSDMINIQPLVMGVMSGIREEAKVRFYRRQFGAPFGAFFLHNGAGAS